jgi:hypothetical protein
MFIRCWLVESNTVQTQVFKRGVHTLRGYSARLNGGGKVPVSVGPEVNASRDTGEFFI